MSEPLRYITNEHGERVGVLLDVEDYQRLLSPSVTDSDLLVGLSEPELQALAQSVLAPVDQTRLDDLLARHAEAPLPPHELTQLDRLLEQIDQLNILKTRARYTLARRQEPATIV